MFRCKFASYAIVSAGYDAQYAVLEVEFVRDGQVWQYQGVPEEIWYQLRRETRPDDFFRSHIQGRYTEKRIWAKAKR